MMNGTEITRERIQNHFAYAWWKYVVLVVAAVAGWNMIYTFSAYQAPPDKRLGVYFVTYPVASETLEWMEQEILQTFPALEDVNCVSVVYTEDDNYYGSIQLSTYIGAGEGDIYILTRERFSAYASGGAFVALDEAVESGALHADDMDVSAGYARDEDSGERMLYGIPADSLYGLMEYGVDNRGLMICVMAYSKNEQAAIACVNWLIETMRAPKPDWLLQAEAEQGITDQDDNGANIPSY